MEMVQIRISIKNNSAAGDHTNNKSIIDAKNAIGKTSQPCLILRILCHPKNILSSPESS